MKPLLTAGHADGPQGGVSGVSVLRKPFAPAELAQRVGEILAARFVPSPQRTIC